MNQSYHKRNEQHGKNRPAEKERMIVVRLGWRERIPEYKPSFREKKNAIYEDQMREKGQPSNLYKKKGCNQNKQVDMKRTQTGDRGRQKRSRYKLAKTQKNLLAEPARRREAASDCFFSFLLFLLCLFSEYAAFRGFSIWQALRRRGCPRPL